MFKRLSLKVWVVALTASLLLVACGSGSNAPAPAPTKTDSAPATLEFKDTLVIGSQYGDPQGSWDPIDTFLLAWGEVACNIYDGLVDRGVDLKLKPGLATEWKFIDDKTIEFKLRQGVKFHNGEPFNADAVVFTFTRLLGPDGKTSPQLSNYTSIDKVVKVDDYTVRFMMKEMDPVIITKLAGYGAMIISPKYYQEKGDAFFNTNPVGTGPYKVTAYTKDSQVVLEANPDYWGDKAKTKKVIVRFIPEDATRVAEFQTGAIDIMQTVPVAQVKTLQADKNVKVLPVGGPTAWALRFDISKSPVDKLEVRQAIGYAIDSKTIIDTILSGNGKLISSFQGDGSFGNNPDLKPLEFNPAKAKELIDKAGAKGAKLDVFFSSKAVIQKEIAQAIASYLKDVGLEVVLNPVDPQQLSGTLITEGKAGHMYLFGWGGWTLDYDNTAYLLYSKGQKWDPYFNDAKVNELLTKERTSTDPKVREQAMKDLTVRLRETMPDVPLYQAVAVWATGAKVQGFVAPPDDRMRLAPVTVTK
ncbi:MAG TPA: ABC transporter substrate-binding protein [Symbiobacteriaceae bacterium]|jgi:peptide/nickel transport system substrate-binding protein